MIEEDLRRKIEKIETDMYWGNGKPGITTRTALCEERIESVRSTVEEIKKDSKAIKMMVIGVILTMVGEIIVRLVVH